ncbi:NADH dehydrogenase-like protein YjlD [compost metagenome]
MNITIVGGGFGGVKAALELAKDSTNVITLISDKPDFQYYPALYGTATGHSHAQSWVPLGQIFAGKDNIRVVLDEIISIDPKKHVLMGVAGGVYAYETVIMALGAVTTYFGIEGLDTYAYGIKSAAEIKKLKHHLYSQLSEEGEIDKHYVIVGAGPTGVELAAALGSYLERLCRHYGVSHRSIKINLIEAAPRVLPKMSETTSAKVTARLKKLGVNVQTGQAVQSATADNLVVNGKPVKSHTVIWTSGVANHPFYKENEQHFSFAPNGRVVVDDYMLAATDVYVIGDNAATPFTGLAQTALHDAIFVADNFRRAKATQPPKQYKAVMPPVVVPVGENWAVFEWRKIRLSGWFASLIRRVADLMGYSDILPIGLSLGVWRAQRVLEDDYFTPSRRIDAAKDTI